MNLPASAQAQLAIDTHMVVADTHVMVAGTQMAVVDAQTMAGDTHKLVADIHRKVSAVQEGTPTQNCSVGATRYPPTTEYLRSHRLRPGQRY